MRALDRIFGLEWQCSVRLELERERTLEVEMKSS